MLSDEIRQLENRFDIIHGHFPADQYHRLMPSAPLAIFIRDPFKHLISHYWHLTATPPAEPKKGAQPDAAYLIQNRQYDIVRFSALPYSRKFFWRYFASVPIDRFNFIGLTEEYELSIKLFNRIFGNELKVYRENIGQKKPANTDSLSKNELSDIHANLKTSYTIYDQARRRFEKLCKIWLAGHALIL